jgi:hypothetical protein
MIVRVVYHFSIVNPDFEPLGLFAFARRDWRIGDLIPQGKATLRVIDVIDPEPRPLDGLEVGVLQVEPA